MAFLRNVLADGPRTVTDIEQAARAVGLLLERQGIKQSKPFRQARLALGIVNKREGFGPGARWSLSLPDPSAPSNAIGVISPPMAPMA
jgi:hypothetical protein